METNGVTEWQLKTCTTSMYPVRQQNVRLNDVFYAKQCSKHPIRTLELIGKHSSDAFTTSSRDNIDFLKVLMLL